MNDERPMSGDPLPDGVSLEDSYTWPVVTTIVIRAVPGSHGLMTEFDGHLPKHVLAAHLMGMLATWVLEPDFQQVCTHDDEDQED